MHYNGTDEHYIYLDRARIQQENSWWVCVCGEAWPADMRPVCPAGHIYQPQADSNIPPD